MGRSGVCAMTTVKYFDQGDGRFISEMTAASDPSEFDGATMRFEGVERVLATGGIGPDVEAEVFFSLG